jgi:hypothetical protein
MTFEPVEVQARWRHDGKFEPTQFHWKGHMYRVESTGRDWEDEEGLHILCMIHGGKVFELVFRLKPAGWLIRPIAGGPQVV